MFCTLATVYMEKRMIRALVGRAFWWTESDEDRYRTGSRKLIGAERKRTGKKNTIRD